MKCVVCDTKIPLGKYECPNCGMKLKKTSVVTYDSSGKGHDHIKVEEKAKIPVQKEVSHSQKIKINKTVKTNQNRTRKPKTDVKMKRIVIAAVIAIVIYGIFINVVASIIHQIGMGMSPFDNNLVGEFYSLDELYEQEEFSNLANQLIELKNQDVDNMTKRFNDVESEEVVYTDDGVETSMYIYGEKSSVDYSLESQYAEDMLVYKAFAVRWTCDENEIGSQVLLNKNDIVELCQEYNVNVDMKGLEQEFSSFINDIGDGGEDYSYSYDGDGYIVYMDAYYDSGDYNMNISIELI